jgi:hypothetical protein
VTLHRAFRYFFPPRRLRDRLPRGGRYFSSVHSRARIEVDAESMQKLKRKGLARTAADARRLVKASGSDVQQIIRAAWKPRRFHGVVRTFKRRLIRLLSS